MDSAWASALLRDANVVDIAIIVWLILAAFHGFFVGLIRIAGNLFGLVMGIVVAGWYYQGLATWGLSYIPSWMRIFSDWIQVLAFIVIFVIFAKVTGLIFFGISTLFNWIPFVGIFNRVGGLLLSLLEAALTIATILFIVSRYPILEPVQVRMQASPIAKFLEQRAVPIVAPLYPELLRRLPKAFGERPELNIIDIIPENLSKQILNSYKELSQ